MGRIVLIALVPSGFAPTLNRSRGGSIFHTNRFAHVLANRVPNAFRFLIDLDLKPLTPDLYTVRAHFFRAVFLAFAFRGGAIL